MQPASTDAIGVLQQDHQKAKALFADFRKAAGDQQKQQEVYELIRDEIELHARVEEQVFYPQAKSAVGQEVPKALEEHGLVKFLLAQLEQTPPTAEQFEAKMTVLMELVEHHVQEEESQLFPKVRQALGGERLSSMAEEITRAKSQLGRADTPKRSSGQQATPRVNPVQVQKFLDGVDYPVGKTDLVEQARRNRADRNVLSALEGLPERQDKGPTEVSEALAGG